MHCDKDDIIKNFDYDPSDEGAILARAKDLVGHSILDVILLSPLDNKTKLDPRNKGAIGNIIEEHWFGIKNNSSPEPDFVDAGIELKVIPLEKRKGGLSVKERTRELGIRKALGATPGSIINLILTESVLITAFSGYIGLVAGVGVIELGLSHLPVIELFQNPQVDFKAAIGAIILLVAAGLIAGFVPARKAANIMPVDALRNE